MRDQETIQNEEVQLPEFASLDMCSLQKQPLSQHSLEMGLNTITYNAAVSACEKERGRIRRWNFDADDVCQSEDGHPHALCTRESTRKKGSQ